MGWNYLSIPKHQRYRHWNLGMDKYFYPTLYWTCDHFSILESKLIHNGENGPWQQIKDDKQIITTNR